MYLLWHYIENKTIYNHLLFDSLVHHNLCSIIHFSFYHKGRRIRSTDTPITLSLSDGDKIKTHIPEPDHDDYDSDCVYLSE